MGSLFQCSRLQCHRFLHLWVAGAWLVLMFILSGFKNDCLVSGQPQQPRIAIIGQGISGSFVTKYLTEYDVDCQIDTLTVFEAVPIQGPVRVTDDEGTDIATQPKRIDGPGNQKKNTEGKISADDEDRDYFQGSRVSSVQIPFHENSIREQQQRGDDDDDNAENNRFLNIETGASIFHMKFYYILEMIQNDPTLEIGAPFNTGNDEQDAQQPPRSLGIYQGNSKWAVRTRSGSGNNTSWWSSWSSLWTKYTNKLILLARYNFEFITMNRLVQQTIAKFEKLPELLSRNDHDTFFQSPDEIWERLGLYPLVHTSLSQVLDAVGLKSSTTTNEDLSPSSSISSIIYDWKKWIWPFQGSLRDELITAINLVNYNQNNDQVNGLVGLGSFSAATSPLFSIKGGNHAVVRSALRQAQQIRSSYCASKYNGQNQQQEQNVQVQRISQRITHVISTQGAKEDHVDGNPVGGLELYSTQQIDQSGDDHGEGEEQQEQLVSLGKFDIVILSAPLHQSRIQFLVQSKFDSAVLQPMPLGGLIVNEDSDDIRDNRQTQEQQQQSHEGRDPLLTVTSSSSPESSFLPEAVSRRPYTQVVTTVIRRGKLQGAKLGLLSESEMPPKSIIVTETGKADLFNITAITRIHAQEGVYKLFSNSILNQTTLSFLFGNQVETEYAKVWGGPYGGATPDYQGQGKSAPFLLYDGAEGLQGHTKSGALYYPNAMEHSSLACMEISAIGAKAVAKLIANRYGWVNVSDQSRGKTGDEL